MEWHAARRSSNPVPWSQSSSRCLQAQDVFLAASILEAAELALGQSTVTLEIDRSLSRLWTADM
jgi:hypothetical protein